MSQDRVPEELIHRARAKYLVAFMRTCGQERCYGGRAVDVEERQRQSDRRDPHRWMRITSQSLHRRIERFAHGAPREEDCLDGLRRHPEDAICGGAEDVR